MHYKLYSYNPDSDFNPDLEMVFPYTQSLLEMTVYQKKKKKKWNNHLSSDEPLFEPGN